MVGEGEGKFNVNNFLTLKFGSLKLANVSLIPVKLA